MTMDRVAFADLAARSLSAGLFGMRPPDPQRFLGHLAHGRIHPDAIVVAASGLALVYLFRIEIDAPWELRFAVEPEDTGRPGPALLAIERRGLLLQLVASCSALGLTVYHSYFRKADVATEMADLLGAGFTLDVRDPQGDDLVFYSWSFSAA